MSLKYLSFSYRFLFKEHRQYICIQHNEHYRIYKQSAQIEGIVTSFIEGLTGGGGSRETDKNSEIRSALYLAHDVISLTKELEPVLQYPLVLVIQIMPLGPAVFWLERRAT